MAHCYAPSAHILTIFTCLLISLKSSAEKTHLSHDLPTQHSHRLTNRVTHSPHQLTDVVISPVSPASSSPDSPLSPGWRAAASSPPPPPPRRGKTYPQRLRWFPAGRSCHSRPEDARQDHEGGGQPAARPPTQANGEFIPGLAHDTNGSCQSNRDLIYIEMACT